MSNPPRTRSRWDQMTNRFKRQLLIDVLEMNGWNVAAAARYLQLQRTYLHRLLRDHNIPLVSRR